LVIINQNWFSMGSRAIRELVRLDPTIQTILTTCRLSGHKSTARASDVRLSWIGSPDFRSVLAIVSSTDLIFEISGYFLILVAEREQIGIIGTAPVYKVTRTLVVPVPRATGFYTEEEVLTPPSLPRLTPWPQRKAERNYLKVLTKSLEDSEFYFSYDYDITRRAQDNLLNPKTDVPLWQRVDGRFFWNKYVSNQVLMF